MTTEKTCDIIKLWVEITNFSGHRFAHRQLVTLVDRIARSFLGRRRHHAVKGANVVRANEPEEATGWMDLDGTHHSLRIYASARVQGRLCCKLWNIGSLDNEDIVPYAI